MPLHFFPEIATDLTKVTWGHALNNQELVTRALNSSSPIMMLEADVLGGQLIGTASNDSELIPIMAHPPHTTSDISLAMWIQEVIKANQEGRRKGVKLDFKDQNIVLQSLNILKKHLPSTEFPLWLNADILEGPGGGDSKPIDAEFFLRSCTEFFPDATLSLGWTTRFKKGEEQKYDEKMIANMKEAIKKNEIRQPITFPIRATFVGNSLDSLHSLALSHPKDSFTVWTHLEDEVDMETLAKFQDLIGEDRVYFDLPEEEKLQIQKFRK